MILDVKSRRPNNIPPPPKTYHRRLEQSFRFVSRPSQIEDYDLGEHITHLFSEVSIFVFEIEKTSTNQVLNIL